MEQNKQYLIEKGFPSQLVQVLTAQESKLCCDYAAASEAYYVSDSPIMSDSEFDLLTAKIEQTNLQIHNWLQTVIFDKDKFVQKTYEGNDFTQEMISLFKIKENNKPNLCRLDIKRFFGAKYPNQKIYVAPKFDGCSLKATFETVMNTDGTVLKIKQVITRGGIDVTNMMKSIIIRDINKHLVVINLKTMCITGELVIRKERFKTKYSSEVGGDYENPRNFVAGILKSKAVNPEILEDLDFIPCTDGINPIKTTIPFHFKHGIRCNSTRFGGIVQFLQI